MTVRKTLLLLLATMLGPNLWLGSSFATEIAPQDSLVSVRMNADFHPELEFRIAEALRRPPVDWNFAKDHTYAEIAQPVDNQDISDEIIARWEALYFNSPTQVEDKVSESLASQMKVLEEAGKTIQAISSDLIASWFQETTYFAANQHPADFISLDDLPKIHTGEEIALQLEAEYVQFPLDPYGYEEYNCYFEPEIYDWFVFVTDDLTVVYVHEDSDVMPLKVEPETLAADADESAVPESLKVVIREAVRSAISGEIEVMDFAMQAKNAWQSATSPIWNRYVKENQLFRIERVAQLREMFRF
ncbi:hypothetical protein [Blastopirellula marina]|uniref:Uncharacterized protein n=1 Tax=Blastopirellula marina TaxID=124 RepID=A0A2S8G2D3_9BACT|nr:hypothetical protein [Blastopirellula marina]PQO38294.1 hypothetical protein C5Y98_09510 [Blastopirellula marina]PTL44950.1 hypothetical protein C5Y97_09515 [Blastopirellula marina]